MNFSGAANRPMVDDIVGALPAILSGSGGYDALEVTDLAYLEAAHPDIHQIVRDYLARMAAGDG